MYADIRTVNSYTVVSFTTFTRTPAVNTQISALMTTYAFKLY